MLFPLALGACIDDHKPPQSPPPEYSEQEDYANTPTTGPGAETSNAYYGVGSTSSEAPQHQPAHPTEGGHQPY
jgi:hypothetical protein